MNGFGVLTRLLPVLLFLVMPSVAQGAGTVDEGEVKTTALVNNDAVVLGLLIVILGFVFWTSSLKGGFWEKLYKIIPMLLLCYFLPSCLTLFGIVDPEQSNLYTIVSRYLLPTSLVFLTLSIDLGAVLRLGPKAVVMFLTGTVGVVIGGPLAVLLFATCFPNVLSTDPGVETWRGLSTVAGSWIGGGANMTAMKEVYLPDSDESTDGLEQEVGDQQQDSAASELFSVMVAVDVLVAEVWMAFLLIGVGKAELIDRIFKADASAVEQLKQKMETFSLQQARNPTTADLFVLLAVGFGVTALSHGVADVLAPWIGENYPALKSLSLHSSFLWLIVLATTGGVLLSFTKARNLEGVGASKLGTVFIFLLVATIGLKMNVLAILEHPGLFLLGVVWMLIHVGLLLVVGLLIRAPYFFLAVGSKANIGGAASAPVVAAAFHPALAPVGVLLAVLGYALGTYGAYLCAQMMRIVSP